MDLDRRDHIAIIAMQSMLSLGGTFLEEGMVLADNIARNAYKIADAMERARSGLPVRQGPLVSRKSLKPKATKDIWAKILEMHREGLSNKQIADKLGINGQSVNGVVACSKRLIAPKKQ